MRRALFTAWLAAMLLAGTPAPPAAAATDEVLPRPYALQPQIRFWKRVYTEVDTNGGFVHDAEHLDVVYEVVRFPEGLSYGERQERSDERKAYFRGILLALADGKRDDLTRDEQRVLRLWPRGVTPETLREAAENVRFQLGQADRFREGLVRSGAWEAHIRHVLAESDVPADLAALPHVESSFNPLAYSKAGAAGLWQFMPSTGRRFLRVDDVVDERFDPWRASEAAARYLAENYRVTGAWPLAITGYNHGAGGMKRAAQQLGTDDIGVIVRRYKGPSFGFASRNFYTSFLAACDVDRSPEQYFGPITRQAPDDSRRIVLERATSLRTLERSLGVSSGPLRDLNLGLREPFWTGRRYAPAGYALRVPRHETTEDAAVQLASATPDPEPAVAPKKGSAKRKGAATSVASLSKAKGVRTVSKADAARPRAAASRTHRVRPGETVSSLARRYGVSESAIMAANGMRNGRSLRAGQTLRIPAKRSASTSESDEA